MGTVIVHIVIVTVAAAEQEQGILCGIQRDRLDGQRLSDSDIGHRKKRMYTVIITVKNAEGYAVAGTFCPRGIVDRDASRNLNGDIAGGRNLERQNRVIVQTRMDMVLLMHTHLEIVFTRPPFVPDEGGHIFEEIGSLGRCHIIPSAVSLCFGYNGIGCAGIGIGSGKKGTKQPHCQSEHRTE